MVFWNGCVAPQRISCSSVNPAHLTNAHSGGCWGIHHQESVFVYVCIWGKSLYARLMSLFNAICTSSYEWLIAIRIILATKHSLNFCLIVFASIFRCSVIAAHTLWCCCKGQFGNLTVRWLGLCLVRVSKDKLCFGDMIYQRSREQWHQWIGCFGKW